LAKGLPRLHIDRRSARRSVGLDGTSHPSANPIDVTRFIRVTALRPSSS